MSPFYQLFYVVGYLIGGAAALGVILLGMLFISFVAASCVHTLFTLFS